MGRTGGRRRAGVHTNALFAAEGQSGKRDDYVVNPHLTSERHLWVQNICYQIFITRIYFPRLNYCKTHLPLEGITTGCISFVFLSQIWSMKQCLFDIETYCKHFLKLNQQMISFLIWNGDFCCVIHLINKELSTRSNMMGERENPHLCCAVTAGFAKHITDQSGSSMKFPSAQYLCEFKCFSEISYFVQINK